MLVGVTQSNYATNLEEGQVQLSHTISREPKFIKAIGSNPHFTAKQKVKPSFVFTNQVVADDNSEVSDSFEEPATKASSQEMTPSNNNSRSGSRQILGRKPSFNLNNLLASPLDSPVLIHMDQYRNHQERNRSPSIKPILKRNISQMTSRAASPKAVLSSPLQSKKAVTFSKNLLVFEYAKKTSNH